MVIAWRNLIKSGILIYSLNGNTHQVVSRIILEETDETPVNVPADHRPAAFGLCRAGPVAPTMISRNLTVFAAAR
jgi:hypothetical protein